MKGEFKIGSVVLSKAGHDKDSHFIVVELVNDEFVKIVNGRTRKLIAPKLKKKKHLKLKGIVLEDIAQKLINKTTLTDTEIYKKLKTLGEDEVITLDLQK